MAPALTPGANLKPEPGWWRAASAPARMVSWVSVVPGSLVLDIHTALQREEIAGERRGEQREH
jgi:hypothetical protein